VVFWFIVLFLLLFLDGGDDIPPSCSRAPLRYTYTSLSRQLFVVGWMLSFVARLLATVVLWLLACNDTPMTTVSSFFFFDFKCCCLQCLLNVVIVVVTYVIGSDEDITNTLLTRIKTSVLSSFFRSVHLVFSKVNSPKSLKTVQSTILDLKPPRTRCC
jgi:hypothetical protein